MFKKQKAVIEPVCSTAENTSKDRSKEWLRLSIHVSFTG